MKEEEGIVKEEEGIVKEEEGIVKEEEHMEDLRADGVVIKTDL